MASAITAANANRQFSEILRRVRDGNSYVVTSHGRPVARILPFEGGSGVKKSARTTLFGRLRSARAVKAGRWTRDELYED